MASKVRVYTVVIVLEGGREEGREGGREGGGDRGVMHAQWLNHANGGTFFTRLRHIGDLDNEL